MDTFQSYSTTTTEVHMSGKRYTEEFKVEAAKQVIDYGHRARHVAERLGISLHSLYG